MNFKVSDDTVFNLRKALETVLSSKSKSPFSLVKPLEIIVFFRDEQFIKLFTYFYILEEQRFFSPH